VGAENPPVALRRTPTLPQVGDGAPPTAASSPDGHARMCDAAAEGVTASEGVGLPDHDRPSTNLPRRAPANARESAAAAPARDLRKGDAMTPPTDRDPPWATGSSAERERPERDDEPTLKMQLAIDELGDDCAPSPADGGA
jgi:hypothetical protein